MASVFKPTFTRYVDPGGKRVSRDTPGARKVREKATKWYGQYTDADDKLTRTPLSPDKVAARQMLANLVREAERGKAGLTDPRAEQKQAPIESQVKDYEGHLRNKGVSDKHLAETLRRLRAVLVGCKTRTLADPGRRGGRRSDEEYLPDIGQGVQQVVPQDPTPGRGCLGKPRTGLRGDPTPAPGVDL